MEDLVGNEQNGYPVPDSNKTIINITNEPFNIHRKIPKREIMGEVTEKILEKMIDIVNQKIQEALKNFQDTTSKETEKAQKQLNKL
jgi:hypothetical protein